MFQFKKRNKIKLLEFKAIIKLTGNLRIIGIKLKYIKLN
jgi:hypothetical protein